MKRVGVKVCGVTRPEDARLAVELGADLLGLNFWPGSPRCIGLEQARRVAAAVRDRVKLVGVWVDPQREQVEKVGKALDLDLLQFHGDEQPADLEPFGRRAIKAFRVGPDFDPLELERFPHVWGFLFDRAGGGAYGGTGRPWSYERIAILDPGKPILVAGGLRPENVAEAIARSRADIVDVCSGVESSPGVKDPALLARFFREVRHAEETD